MTKRLPKYVTRFVSQHGSVRYRFRRKGHPSYYFVSRYGSKGFRQEYEACLAGEPQVKTERRSFRTKKPLTSASEGRVYFIGSRTGPIKIGYSKNPASRLRELRIGSHVELNVLASRPGTLADEWALHERFSHLRLRGEWFDRAPELMAEIRSSQK
ncbi:hypothetical protein GR702_04530 [Novosphingobium sp. FGD1]|uniref:GIY-YIG nuclease family protein n=1 Tax=Novosphingobium silvae TaxID=2692619 RepID=A0A7X4GEB6_9SPHN|nr:hypothetical protein [Novosphingobium silvae]